MRATARSGESRYKVEPNVKDGKGGLRDLHTLHWLSKYLYGQGVGAATVAAGIFRPEEVATFRRCEDFLWTIRCFLHFLSGRSEEVLTFDVQPWLAAQLGYNDRGGLIAVERFMKHYFLVAKDVGDLTTILCSALEMQQLKASPGLRRFLRPLNWKQRRQLRARTDFRIDNDRLNVADQDVFKRDPVNLIRFFAEAHLSNSFLHPDAIRLLRQSKRLIDDDLRDNPEANRIFVELLTGDTNPEMSLRRMNEAGRARPLRAGVRPRRRHDAVQHVSQLYGRRAPRAHRRHAHGHRARRRQQRAAAVDGDHQHHQEPARAVRCRLPARHRQGAHRGSLDRRRAHRTRAVPALRTDAGGDRDRRLADRAAFDDEQHRAKPRSVRSQDHPRLRRRGAKPGAVEAAAAAHRRRHPRRWARRVERLEGPAACARCITRPSRWSPAATRR